MIYPLFDLVEYYGKRYANYGQDNCASPNDTNGDTSGVENKTVIH
jgi:hypothetical protein